MVLYTAYTSTDLETCQWQVKKNVYYDPIYYSSACVCMCVCMKVWYLKYCSPKW